MERVSCVPFLKAGRSTFNASVSPNCREDEAVDAVSEGEEESEAEGEMIEEKCEKVGLPREDELVKKFYARRACPTSPPQTSIQPPTHGDKTQATNKTARGDSSR